MDKSMFDSSLPEQNNIWDASINNSFTNSVLNLESTSESLPLNRTNIAFSQPATDIKSFTSSDNNNLFVSHFSLAHPITQALNSGNYNSTNLAEESSVDPLTGEVLSNDIVAQALQTAQGYLKGFATVPDFNAKMNLAFGNSWNLEVASDLVQEFTGGNFSNLPGIEILPSAAINGANGAFASVTNTIYLSQEFIAQNAGNPEAIASVLLEEIGHYIDSKINVLDAAGDEGDIFAATLQGKQLSEGELLALKVEDDTATITLDGKAIQIEMDNTLGSALNIGTLLSGTRTLSEFVGTVDTNDFYRFSLSNNSNFSLILNGLSGDADVQLIQDVNNNGMIDSGDVLQSSTNGGTTPDSISGTLNVGNYFARVYPMSGVNTYYNLSFTATPARLNNADNSLALARNIGTLNGAQTFSDFVGTTDPNDFYRFTLNSNSNFSLTLNGLSANADVQLIQDVNNNGIVDSVDVLQSSTNGGTTPDSISRTLNVGTYFARVYPMSGVNTNYNLSLSVTPDNAGNSLALARNIGTLINGTQSFSDFVGTADTDDFYRFSLGVNSNFSLTLNGLSGDADVQLIQDVNNNGIVDSGDVLQSSTDAGTTADSISRTLNVGTYFARIYPMSGVKTNYNLSFTANPLLNGDWFSQNLRDSEIINLARNLAFDNQLNRSDMLAIFSSAQDSSVIDTNEVNDLRTLVNNTSRFAMQDHVRWLSARVAEGASVNMAASQFESSLVGRWFRGTVAPTARFYNQGQGRTYNLTYTEVQGRLFDSSAGRARIGDIDQGSFLGDCAFLAALGATFGQQSNDAGNASSSIINNMIIDNGDNTYTMRFYSGNKAEYATVDRRLPFHNEEWFGATANGSRDLDDSANVLWVPLVERAYAQWREWREGQPGYNLIGNGDHPWRPLNFITGRSASQYGAGGSAGSFSNVTFNQIMTALQNGQFIETARSASSNTSFIVGGHAYTLTNAYSSNGQQRIVVRNPWGVDGRTASGNSADGFIDLSFDEFRSQFDSIAFA